MPSSACDWSSDVCSSDRSEEHTSELQSRSDLVCRLLLEKKKKKYTLNLKRTRLNTSHHQLAYDLVSLDKNDSSSGIVLQALTLIFHSTDPTHSHEFVLSLF